MKPYTIEQLCIAAAPTASKIDLTFTDSVMGRIRHARQLPFKQAVLRVQPTNKQGLFARLRHLPKFAVVLLAIVALIIASTTVYAAYLLWPKPHASVSKPTANGTGRLQLEVSFDQCGDQRTPKKEYELKQGAPITPDQIPQIIQAHCELDAIGTWAKKVFPDPDAPQFKQGVPIKPYDSVHVEVWFAAHIRAHSDTSITLEGQPKYGLPDKTFAVSAQTTYVADGKKVARQALKTGDVVVSVLRQTIHMVPRADCDDKHCSMSSTEMHEELLAVVKLDLPFEAYDQIAWQSLAEREPCPGNEADSCVSNGSIDLFMGNASIPLHGTKVYKRIQGKLLQQSGNSFSIVTASGRTFTFTMDSDIIGSFNTHRSSDYNNLVIVPGDTIQVDYIEDKATHSQTIVQKDISMIREELELVRKADPIKKY